MDLEPLRYSTNSREPSEQSQRRVTEIAGLLKSKPHLAVTFCPVVTALERAEPFNGGQAPAAGVFPSPEQRQRLLDLGGARGRVLRSALIDAGAPANQLVICEPRVDMTQFGLSFVSVSL